MGLQGVYMGLQEAPPDHTPKSCGHAMHMLMLMPHACTHHQTANQKLAKGDVFPSTR